MEKYEEFEGGMIQTQFSYMKFSKNKKCDQNM